MDLTWKLASDVPMVPRAKPWMDAAQIARAHEELVGPDPRKAHAAARLLGVTEAAPRASRSVREKLDATENQEERTRLAGLLLRVGMDDDVDHVADDAFGTPFPRDCLASHAAARLYFRERVTLSERPTPVVLPRLTRIFARLPMGELNEHASEAHLRGRHVLSYRQADQLDRASISAAAELLVAAWHDERQDSDAARLLARLLFDVVEERGSRWEGQRVDDASGELARHLLFQPERAPAHLVLLAATWLEHRINEPDAGPFADRLLREGIDGRIDGDERLRDTSAAVVHVLPPTHAVRVLVEVVRNANTPAAARARATAALGTLRDEGAAALRALASDVPFEPHDLLVAVQGASSDEAWAALAPRLLRDPAMRALLPELHRRGLLTDPRFLETARALLRVEESAGIALLALLHGEEAERHLDAWLADRDLDHDVVRAVCDVFTASDALAGRSKQIQEPRLARLLMRWLEADIDREAEIPLLMALASACGPIALPVLRERLEQSRSPGILKSLITSLESRAEGKG